jgi:methionyl-tRNA formyltransferase
MRIVFFGTPEFAAYSLEKILEAGWNVVAVVTAPDKPAGRGMKLRESAVKQLALRYHLPVLQPEKLKSDDFMTALKSFNPDLGIVIAFRMMPEMVWSLPKMGTFNLHASLLPQYRGAAPINHAIINGEKVSGVTTFFLKHEIDTGDIIYQLPVNIEETDNAGTLHDKLMITGAGLVLKTLESVASGNWPSIPQQLTGHENIAPKIYREFCQLTPSATCLQNHNKVRGLYPVPAAWVDTSTGQIKILGTAVSPFNTDNQTAELHIEKNKLYFRCSDGWLDVLELQPAGKPKMTAADYINGLANQKK